jgi:hypothetical protein
MTHSGTVFINDFIAKLTCYFVTQLDDAILRIVDIELSGEYHEPSQDEVVRTGADPRDGACKLASGDTVSVF